MGPPGQTQTQMQPDQGAALCHHDDASWSGRSRASLPSMCIGLTLDRVLTNTPEPLFVYHACMHVFFAVAASFQALAFLPLRGLDHSTREII